ncbi:MAG: hypothetical protein JSS99_00115 [Actinobacteria bacterium]|nr:hypothetical protein [Actinomycetota bacterium]
MNNALTRWIAVRSRRASVLIATLAALGGGLAIAAPASADVVFSQGGVTMIWVGTGAKDYVHHTQWVSYITVETGGAYCPTQTEAWTYGFYRSTQLCGPWAAVTWYISRWVPSGNSVCGSSYVWSRMLAPTRNIACIGIRV